MDVGGTVMGEEVAGKEICQAQSPLQCPSLLCSLFERRKNITLNTRALLKSFCFRVSPQTARGTRLLVSPDSSQWKYLFRGELSRKYRERVYNEP